MSSTVLNPALYSGSYYQVPTSTDTSGNAANTASDPQAASTDSLLQALNQTSPQDSSLLDTTDLVDLSPQAQSILNGLDGTGSTDSSSGILGGSGFVLSAQQEQQISAIVAKYKDAPFTQDTYNQIQNDLKAAGLSPDQLSIQDEMRNFNPTNILIDALNGVDDTNDIMNFVNNPTEQTNANSYMQQIFNQWQSISTTADQSGNSSGTSTGTSAASSA